MADVLKHSEDLAVTALTQVSNCPSSSEPGDKFGLLVGHVISISSGEDWKKFSHDVCQQLIQDCDKQKCVLPSALISTLNDQLENLLSVCDLCDEFMKIIHMFDFFEVNVCAQFFWNSALISWLKFLSSYQAHFDQTCLEEFNLGGPLLSQIRRTDR